MPKTYSRMPDECTVRVAHLLKCFHPELVEAGVTIDLLSISTDGDDQPLKLHGYPCAAVVRVVGAKDRAKGQSDAEIVFDEEQYHALNDAERDALCDHELYHIELKIAEEAETKDGTIIPRHVIIDAQGRPKLGLRKHDADFGWFSAIAERHGAASMECKQAAQLALVGRQTYFAFVEATPALTSGEPSAKVRALAKEIEGAHPAVRAAARDLVSHLRKHNVTMTMKSGGVETKIA